jgi:hypothetical protein
VCKFVFHVDLFPAMTERSPVGLEVIFSQLI